MAGPDFKTSIGDLTGELDVGKATGTFMYRSIQNSHMHPPPSLARGVGNLIQCLNFVFRTALQRKVARV